MTHFFFLTGLFTTVFGGAALLAAIGWFVQRCLEYHWRIMHLEVELHSIRTECDIKFVRKGDTDATEGVSSVGQA